MAQLLQISEPVVNGLFKIQGNAGEPDIFYRHIQKNDVFCQGSKLLDILFAELSDTYNAVRFLQDFQVVYIRFKGADDCNAVFHTEIFNSLADLEIIAVVQFLLGGKPLKDAQGKGGFGCCIGFFCIMQRIGGFHYLLLCFQRSVQGRVMV